MSQVPTGKMRADLGICDLVSNRATWKRDGLGTAGPVIPEPPASELPMSIPGDCRLEFREHGEMLHVLGE